MAFLSATQAVTGLIDQTFQILGRLRDTRETQQALVDVLTRHQNELSSLKSIIKVIKKYKDLQTLSVTTELQQLRDIQKKLLKFVNTLESQSQTRANQFMRQLVHGSADEKKLATIMDELIHLKTTLLLNIQAANVGVTRTIGEDLVANASIIKRIDESLRKHILDCEGLKIAQLLKGRRPSSESDYTSIPRVMLIYIDDGLVPLTTADLKALGGNEEVNSDSDNSSETFVDDVDSSSDSGSDSPVSDGIAKTERIVLQNTTRDQALQINCAIGEDMWKDIDRVVIKRNRAGDKSMQVNYAMSLEVVLAVLKQQQAITGNDRTLEERPRKQK